MDPQALTHTTETDPGLDSVTSMAPGESLSFRNRPGMTDAQLRSMLSVGLLSGVRVIDLGGCHGITDHGLALLSGMQSLVRISLEGCVNVTRAGLKALAALTTLRELDVSRIPGIDNRALAVLLALPSLRVLRMCGAPVTPEGFLESEPAAPLLRLDVSRCPAITAEDLPAIAAHLNLPPSQLVWSA
ncbi:MAG: hypothetical protein KF696_13085 [Planctomycetes bacterium]|nr:hypothetical protein [Planctomycetota bacterium]MCW8135491.1 hypothetical protein [Planctomycetota bacterium]